MNEEAKPTPGPWEIVITRVGPDEIRAGDGSGDLICELPYGASAEPDASTANLIAAAPELYAALQFARKYITLRTDRGDQFPSQLVGAIDAALAKASA